SQRLPPRPTPPGSRRDSPPGVSSPARCTSQPPLRMRSSRSWSLSLRSLGARRLIGSARASRRRSALSRPSHRSSRRASSRRRDLGPTVLDQQRLPPADREISNALTFQQLRIIEIAAVENNRIAQFGLY